jgi:putative ABC transport system substrate-binding protein
MLRKIIIVLVFLTCAKNLIFAQNTYAFIKSKKLSQIDLIINGFKESMEEGKIISLDLNSKIDPDKLNQFINKNKPNVLITCGSVATKTAILSKTKLPIVFTMVINYKKYDFYKNQNVTGISMEIPPIILFSQLKLLLPDINTIGVPYHPQVSNEIVTEAVNSANEINVKIVKIPINDVSIFKQILIKRKNSFQSLWMLADIKLYNRSNNSFKDIIKFSTSNKKPLMVFSENFLKIGAFFSISINYHSIGSQLNSIVQRILVDKEVPVKMGIAIPIGTYSVINKTVAEDVLKIKIDPMMYSNIDKVYPLEKK